MPPANLQSHSNFDLICICFGKISDLTSRVNLLSKRLNQRSIIKLLISLECNFQQSQKLHFQDFLKEHAQTSLEATRTFCSSLCGSKNTLALFYTKATFQISPATFIVGENPDDDIPTALSYSDHVAKQFFKSLQF